MKERRRVNVSIMMKASKTGKATQTLTDGHDRRNHLKPRLVMLILLTVTVLAGCVTHTRYRTHHPEKGTVLSDTNQISTLEQTTNYLLGIVEIDDQGWLWDRQQMETVLDRVASEQQPGRQGVQVYVFVHGWQHNAQYSDENLVMFRKMLKTLDRTERRRAEASSDLPRKTVGLYVGWRGATQPIPIVRAVTFWNRKRTAHEVGRGALSELLLRTERFVNETKKQERGDDSPSRLVVMAHSFGGAATYSALAPVFMDRVIQPREENGRLVATGFGDLVMLINPAFEAARYGVLRDATLAEWKKIREEKGGGPAPRLNLVILTSIGDAATGMAFPIGRGFSALRQAHQDPRQYQANITAVGHYKPFITHNLVPSPKMTNDVSAVTNAVAFTEQGTATESNIVEIAQEAADTIRARQRERADPKAKNPNQPLRLTYTTLNGRTNALNEPFMVVSVHKRIIPDHSRIQKPILLSFLTDYLGYLAANGVQERMDLAVRNE